MPMCLQNICMPSIKSWTAAEKTTDLSLQFIKLNNTPAGGLTAEGIPAGGMPAGGIPTGGILGGLRGILPAGGFPTDGIWNSKIHEYKIFCTL